jgi:hypothetical protein
MTDFSKVVVALLVLALISVLLASGQTAALVKTAGDFLSNSATMVVKS